MVLFPLPVSSLEHLTHNQSNHRTNQSLPSCVCGRKELFIIKCIATGFFSPCNRIISQYHMLLLLTGNATRQSGFVTCCRSRMECCNFLVVLRLKKIHAIRCGQNVVVVELCHCEPAIVLCIPFRGVPFDFFLLSIDRRKNSANYSGNWHHHHYSPSRVVSQLKMIN